MPMVFLFLKRGVSLLFSPYSIGDTPLGLTRLRAASDPHAKAQTKVVMVKDFMMSCEWKWEEDMGLFR